MKTPYVKTDTMLDKILANTAQEVAARMVSVPLDSLIVLATKVASPPRDILAALQRETVALIAEIKRASPSKGILIESFDPDALARTYAANGAAAISVLTDTKFFMGGLDHMMNVREAVSVPILRKDFIISSYQVYEARAAGADAVLLIVAALADGQLAELKHLVNALGMVALIEVHNVEELERALHIKPELIGINNRDLKTFEVSLETTERLAKLVPDDVTLVAESGIYTGEDVRRMGQWGAHAVLVGESLITAEDIGAQAQTLSSQPREAAGARQA